MFFYLTNMELGHDSTYSAFTAHLVSVVEVLLLRHGEVVPGLHQVTQANRNPPIAPHASCTPSHTRISRRHHVKTQTSYTFETLLSRGARRRLIQTDRSPCRWIPWRTWQQVLDFIVGIQFDATQGGEDRRVHVLDVFGLVETLEHLEQFKGGRGITWQYQCPSPV